VWLEKLVAASDVRTIYTIHKYNMYINHKIVYFELTAYSLPVVEDRRGCDDAHICSKLTIKKRANILDNIRAHFMLVTVNQKQEQEIDRLMTLTGQVFNIIIESIWISFQAYPRK
jgi:hypothetical protein